jgi:homeobox protein cut-like
MEEKVREMVEMKQRSMTEDSQKTLEALKERYANKHYVKQFPC